MYMLDRMKRVLTRSPSITPQEGHGSSREAQSRESLKLRDLSSQVAFALTEAQRVAHLYEATICRLTAIEQSVERLLTRHGVERSPAATVQSSATDDVTPSTAAIVMPLVQQFDEARKLRNKKKTMALFYQLAEEYAKAVTERDDLLNLRDSLMRQQQDVARPGGIAKGAKSVVVPGRPPFPFSEIGVAPPTVTIVDVGAQNLTSEDHIYAPVYRTGLATVIGFEPLETAAEERRQSDPGILILNHLIGSGGPATFRTTRFDPASSLLEPNMDFLKQFAALPDMCEPVDSREVITKRLDDIPEVSQCDFLKIDVQGGELDVLKGADRLLSEVVTIHCEVEFAPVYKDQPLFADVDQAVRRHGFELMDLMNAGYARYADLQRPMVESRLMWAEAVYFMHSDRLAALGPSKVLRAAFIAHVNYGMFDLAAHYLRCYDKITGGSTEVAYNQAIAAARSS